MSYKVKITQSQTYTRMAKEWQPVKGTGADTIYGYTPEKEITSTRDVDVYEQVVEDLDLTAVIKAINGIS